MVKSFTLYQWGSRRRGDVSTPNPIQGHATQLHHFLHWSPTFQSFHLFSGGNRALNTRTPLKRCLLGGTCAVVRGKLATVSLSFHNVDPRDRTRVARLGGSPLHPSAMPYHEPSWSCWGSIYYQRAKPTVYDGLQLKPSEYVTFIESSNVSDPLWNSPSYVLRPKAMASRIEHYLHKVKQNAQGSSLNSHSEAFHFQEYLHRERFWALSALVIINDQLHED